jgi:RecA-family ATPase
MFEGEPDVGKSTMTLAWAALVSTGREWPNTLVGGKPAGGRRGLPGPRGVVLVGVEDDLADTVVPRLLAAGADMGQVSTMMRPRDANGRPVPFVIPDDVDKLQAAIGETDAALVIVDPIAAFMSDSVKSGSDSSNRQALMQLADVAEQTGAAIVLVRHLNKATGMTAKHRGGGSIAYTALARSVLVAARMPRDDPDGAEPDDAQYGLARTKGNLAPEPSALGYRLVSSPNDPDSPVVEWTGQLNVSADQLVGAEGAKVDARKRAPQRDEAGRLLKEVLADGPMNAAEARKLVMKEAGCTDKTVSNAAKAVGVKKTAVRDAKGQVESWTWELPETNFRKPM